MKVNVKGLVFVGFAAAIIAGAAKADDKQIVTSKAFTDATYQAKSTVNGVGTEGGSWKVLDTTIPSGSNSANNDTAPTTAAVKAYVDTVATTAGNAQVKSTADFQLGGANGAWNTVTDGSNYTKVNSVTTGEGANAVTTVNIDIDPTKVTSSDSLQANSVKLVREQDAKGYADTKQPKVAGTSDLTKGWVGNGDGQWLEVEDTTYVEVQKGRDANNSKDVMHVALKNMLTSTATTAFDNVGGDTPATQADNSKLPTAAAIKAYVDNKATADLSGKQDKTGATSGYKVGDSDGAWADMGSAVTAATGGYVSVTGGANGAAVAINIDANKIDTAVTSGSSNLVTSDAVYDALNGAQHANFQTYSDTAHQISNGAGGWEALDATINATTAAAGTAPTTGAVKSYVDSAIAAQPSSNIPAQNTSVCTTATPCALVAENGRFNWYVMAVGQATTAGIPQPGDCGNAGGTCPTTAPNS